MSTPVAQDNKKKIKGGFLAIVTGRTFVIAVLLVAQIGLLLWGIERLGEYIHLGKNEQCNGGRTRPSILADCVEAVIAAIYMDGGLDSAERFIADHILSDIRSGRRPARTDYKTQLQEKLQRFGGTAPVYTIVDESGPDHNKTFTASVALHDGAAVRGVGKSKKEAEQAAAKAALEQLES